MARTKSKKENKLVQISISLPSEVVKIVDDMAKAQNRNRSNFIAVTLKRCWEKFDKGCR